jgi:hypothetical protein
VIKFDHHVKKWENKRMERQHYLKPQAKQRRGYNVPYVKKAQSREITRASS